MESLTIKIIQLSHGKSTIIDDDQYDLVSQFRWYAKYSSKDNFYAVAHLKRPDGSDYFLSMSRLIFFGTKEQERLLFYIPCPQDQLVDHINRDSLDNRCQNLRLANKKGNGRNQKMQSGVSRYVGVYMDRLTNGPKKWRGQVTANGKGHKTSKRYTTDVEAAKARDKLALELHGEFAVLNFPEDMS